MRGRKCQTDFEDGYRGKAVCEPLSESGKHPEVSWPRCFQKSCCVSSVEEVGCLCFTKGYKENPLLLNDLFLPQKCSLRLDLLCSEKKKITKIPNPTVSLLLLPGMKRLPSMHKALGLISVAQKTKNCLQTGLSEGLTRAPSTPESQPW